MKQETNRQNEVKYASLCSKLMISDCFVLFFLKTTQHVSDRTRSEPGNINILWDFIALFIFKALYKIL